MATLLQLDSKQLEAFGNRVASRYAAERMPALHRIELFLTEDCTLRCDYCFVNDKNHHKRMSWETAKKAVDFLFEQSPPQSEVEIAFFGGEPLMEFPLVKRIAEYARDQAREDGKVVTFSLTTNGTIMTEEIARFGRAYGFNLMLSIDGTKQAHDLHRVYAGTQKGCWDDVLGENFRLLKSIQGWIGARVTPSPDTVQYLSSGVRTLFNMGVNQFLIGPDQDTAWDERQMATLSSEMHNVVDFYVTSKRKGLPIRIAEFEKTLEDLNLTYDHIWGCDAGRTRAAISTEGDIYPCCKFVRPFPGMEDCCLGNLDIGFKNIRCRMDFVAYQSDDTVCRECSIRDQCGGGCPASNLHLTGSLFTPTPFECFTKKLHVDILTRISSELQA